MKMKPLALLCVGLLVTDVVVAQQSQAPGALVRQLNDSFAHVYDQIAPTVVVIEVRRATDPRMTGLPEGLDFFFRGAPRQDGYPAFPDQGSGFIVSPDGYIITNNHVVDNALPEGMEVKLQDGRKFPARLIGSDPTSDLAVIKIEAKNLPVAQMGDSDAVKVGNFAFAIGAPEALPYTFTVGVISAKGRTDLTSTPNYEEYIQTDASINPGNSGGPLCDIDGRVVGVNTLISGRNRGLGFAIPINLVKNVSEQLIANGRVSRPWLGISIKGIEESVALQRYFTGLDKGVVVDRIEVNTPAFASDLREGDVILKVDDVPVALSRDLQREILQKKVGDNVHLQVWRAGKTSQVVVRAGEQSDQLQRAARRMPGVPPPTESRPPGTTLDFPGMTMQNAAEESGVPGALVTEVAPGTAAAAAGLRSGDVVTEAGGKPIRSSDDLAAVLAETDLSRGVMIYLVRNGQRTYAILKP